MSEQFTSDDYTNISAYKFSELFDLNEIQKLQDLFSAATGVASIVTDLNGTSITEPSGFCKEEDPNIQTCLIGSLLNGRASRKNQGLK